jgi:hypothetical protein
MNTTSGIITLKIRDWSKTKIHRVCMYSSFLVILDHSLIFRVIIPELYSYDCPPEDEHKGARNM